MLTRLGYFVTESSEHFAEYTPYFIKDGREDLIEKFGIPLDEYPKRCVEQIERWKSTSEEYRKANRIEVKQSKEYASEIVNSVWTGEPRRHLRQRAQQRRHQLAAEQCSAVEVPCLVDASGIQPTYVGALPPQLTALIRTNVNVQELTVAALLTENKQHIYHAAMMDPHTAAELDLDQIWHLVDDLLAAHGNWLPEWAQDQHQQDRGRVTGDGRRPHCRPDPPWALAVLLLLATPGPTNTVMATAGADAGRDESAHAAVRARRAAAAIWPVVVLAAALCCCR